MDNRDKVRRLLWSTEKFLTVTMILLSLNYIVSPDEHDSGLLRCTRLNYCSNGVAEEAIAVRFDLNFWKATLIATKCAVADIAGS